MHHLEIKHLRMVAAIAQTGNMTQAAEKLCLSQSALSQQLKDIESKLGIDLFFRTSKKMILTPIGKKLAVTAGRVIEELDETELEIAQIVSGDGGELKVGLRCMFCFKWLPRVMRVFQQKFPNIDLEIGTAGELEEDLENKRFDIIISAEEAKNERFSCLPLFVDQLVCVMPADHPLGGREFVRYRDFADFNLISLAEPSRTRFYNLLLRPEGVEPKRFMTVGQPEAIMEMVASGFGISVFPAWAVGEAVESGQIITRPLTRDGLPLTWYAVFLQSGQTPLFQREFIRIVGKMKESRMFSFSCPMEDGRKGHNRA